MDQPATIAWKYAASLIRVEDLPMVAADLLAAGHDSPSLRDLAGRSRHEHPADIRELFGHTMEELGIQIPDYETAERCSCTTWRHSCPPVSCHPRRPQLESGRGSRR